jgi:formate--tetrahydrofolate ligase
MVNESKNPDLRIAQSITPLHINEIAAKLRLSPDDIEHYGKYKAKIPLSFIDERKVKKSKLILVTAITPTPAGEGKTTVSVGLCDALNVIGKKATAVLREPSLGPVFGMKGGATGGGYSQVVPMEDINLHFTGDFSAVEKANNLLSALINNNIYGRKRNLGIDPRTVRWRWAMDINDRSLRNIITGIGGKTGGFLVESGFNITAASEIMAILCMSTSLQDLKDKIGNIYIGDTFAGQAIYARDLNAHGAMAALMKDAVKPNLVQTLEGNPAIIHGGPFANIAQGTNTILATKVGMSLSDYVVTEAGFGADLGAEKFMNIKCHAAGISPDAVVIVATVRALKYHGGITLPDLRLPNAEAIKQGLENLNKHIENIKQFGLPVVVAINHFITDTNEEVMVIKNHCESLGVAVEMCRGWELGGKGSLDLARQVIAAAESPHDSYIPTYSPEDSIKTKIEKIAANIYGAKSVQYSQIAEDELKRIEELGLHQLPICMAKTQSSLSDNPQQIGRPRDFIITIREVELAAGAGFIIPITGKIMRMPGLPMVPAAENIDIDENGQIAGLF